MGAFKPVPKMETTEPSVELKLKKGGKVKMADGGMPMVNRPAPAIMRQQPVVRRPVTPIMRKEGGETKAMHKAEMKAIKGMKSELKSHEGMPASKAHKGLKTGGMARAVPGGLLPGVTKAHGKGTTGGVRSPGYKGGGSVEPYINTKMHDDAKGNAIKKKGPGGIEGAGYKKGGKACYAEGGVVKAYAQTKMHTAEHGDAVKKKGTGDIEGSKYKAGGHVMHSSTHSKHAYGHKAKGGMCKF